ncbi:MAG: RNA methyltransferase [Chloroflexia bacterium]|nr:RNA methyltransferase [Chloroflexia bacterium]
MTDDALPNRHWLRRVRALRDQAERERDGVCYVEGIRQVIAAYEGGHPLEAVLIEPRRLRSNVAWRTITAMRSAGTPVVELTTGEFERISARDNPVGIAAIIQWTPVTLADLEVPANSFYLVTDGVSDAGNLGTLIRTADSLGASGIIVHGGVDPSHPNALRASLGTAFRLPVSRAGSLDEILEWAQHHTVQTVATSARAKQPAWQVDMARSTALLVGSEGEGLDQETIDRCDETVLIPMAGTATSLNVGVAAGIILYEIQRQRSS